MTTAAVRYRAATQDGRIESGTLDVDSVDGARDLLLGRRCFPIELTPVAKSDSRRGSMSTADVGLGLRILSDLLAAGLPVPRALQTFEDLAPAGWKRIIPHLRDAVRDGKSLATALESAPVELPPLVIGIALAGEAGNGLAGAMQQAAEITESMAATKAAVRAALAYPALLATAGASAIALMIGVVLPRFATILSDLGQALPPSTRIVLRTATVARTLFLPGSIALAILVIGVRAWTSTTAGRRTWHALLLRVPLLGSVRRSTATARATATLAALLKTGVPIRAALAFAARATGDAEVEHRVLSARQRVTTGETMSRALASTSALTPASIRLINAGEESGRVSGMLEHAARIEQERSDRITRTAVRFLEPALIMVFAGIVGLVAAALLQAVYSVRPA